MEWTRSNKKSDRARWVYANSIKFDTKKATEDAIRLGVIPKSAPVAAPAPARPAPVAPRVTAPAAPARPAPTVETGRSAIVAPSLPARVVDAPIVVAVGTTDDPPPKPQAPSKEELRASVKAQEQAKPSSPVAKAVAPKKAELPLVTFAEEPIIEKMILAAQPVAKALVQEELPKTVPVPVRLQPDNSFNNSLLIAPAIAVVALIGYQVIRKKGQRA